MVEQKPNIPTQAETNDPQRYSDRKGGFLGSVKKKGISRRVFASVAVTLGLGGFLGGCGDENKPSETSRQTNITQPTTSENPTTSETDIPYASTTEPELTTEITNPTIEGIHGTELLTIQEQSVFDLPSELSNKILARVGDVDKITYLEAKQNIDSDKKLSIWFVDSGNNNFATFMKDGKYKVYQYSIDAELRGNMLESYVQYSLENGDKLIKFKLGGEFAKKDGDNLSAYLDRVGPILAGAKESSEKMADILKASSELAISIPGISVRYSQEENDVEIKQFVDAIDSAGKFIHDWNNPPVLTEAPDTDVAEELQREFEGLIIEDPDINTLEDLQNLPPNPKYYNIPAYYAEKVSSQQQQAFKEKNPEYKIIYALTDDPSLRSVMTNKPYWSNVARDMSYLGEATGENDYVEINGFVEGVIIVENRVVLKLYDGGISNKKSYAIFDLNKESDNGTIMGFNNLDTNAENDQDNKLRGYKYWLAYFLPDDHNIMQILNKDDFVKIFSFYKDEETGLRKIRGVTVSGNDVRFNDFMKQFD
jgi:hypothetical protein